MMELGEAFAELSKLIEIRYRVNPHNKYKYRICNIQKLCNSKCRSCTHLLPSEHDSICLDRYIHERTRAIC